MNLQEPDDRSNTVRVSGRRFEESPYVSRYDSPELVRGVYAGRFFAIFNGDDPVEKYRVLRRKALIFDTPEKPVEVSGPGAGVFLDKVLARTVSTLRVGRGRYAIACTPQGGVFMDGVVFRLADNRFWYVQADGALETWFLAHSEGFDITISDPGSRVIQIQGPASMDIMRAASAGRIDEGMRYFQAGFFDLGGQKVYVSRTGFTGELGYEIYSLGDATDHLTLWDHLMASGEPYGMEFSSTGSMTIRRIEAGILGNTTDMDTTMTPFEAGLGGVHRHRPGRLRRAGGAASRGSAAGASWPQVRRRPAISGQHGAGRRHAGRSHDHGCPLAISRVRHRLCQVQGTGRLEGAPASHQAADRRCPFVRHRRSSIRRPGESACQGSRQDGPLTVVESCRRFRCWRVGRV